MFKKRKTFTFMEVLISTLILGIGLGFFMLVMVGIKKMEKESAYYIAALNLARDPLEYLEQVRWQHSGSKELKWKGKNYGGGGQPLEELRERLKEDYKNYSQGKEGYPKLLPKEYPKSIYIKWNLYWGKIEGNAYVNTFISWKDKDGQRRGLVLGVVPFRYYNSVSLSINDFYWE